jgi:hypothetical protein
VGGRVQRIQVRVEPGEVDDLHELARWFDDEAVIRRYGSVRTVDWARSPERMGTIDLIELTVGSGLSVAQLILTIIAWRKSRPPQRKSTVIVQYGDMTVTIDNDDPKLAIKLARELEN